jgi:single-stranded DNA-binding protein
MNSSTFLVKLLSEPIQSLVNDNILLVEVQVQFTKRRKKKSKDQFPILLWGNLGAHFIHYYRNGDYVIIEGSLSFEKYKNKQRFQKRPLFTVLRIYPFMLSDEELDA